MSHFGVVYKWMNDKNYGFIREEGRQQDVFLHSSVIRGGQLPMGGEAVCNADQEEVRQTHTHTHTHTHCLSTPHHRRRISMCRSTTSEAAPVPST